MSWVKAELGDYVDILVGAAFKSKFFTDNPDDIPLIKGENIGQGQILWDKSRYWSRNDLDGYQKYFLNYGDVILAMDRPWVTAGLKYAFISKSDPQALLVQRVACIRGINGLLQNFLRCIIASNEFSNYIKMIMGGTNVPHISADQIKSFKFQLPSKSEQERIADILSNYDDLIENNRRRIQLLERSLHLLYKEWFVHLRFPSHEHSKIVDGIPEGWRKCQISELGNIVTGKTPSKKDSDNFNGSIPFVKTPDLHNQIFVIKTEESLSERGLKTQSSKLIPRGSIMISCIGTVGIVSIASYPCQTNQQINSVVCSDNQYSYFTFFALSRLKPLLEAMGGGATMPNVNKTKFSSIQILLPPRSLILSFQESVEASFAQIEKLSIMSEKLKQARDLLLPKLMSGAISV